MSLENDITQIKILVEEDTTRRGIFKKTINHQPIDPKKIEEQGVMPNSPADSLMSKAGKTGITLRHDMQPNKPVFKAADQEEVSFRQEQDLNSYKSEWPIGTQIKTNWGDNGKIAKFGGKDADGIEGVYVEWYGPFPTDSRKGPGSGVNSRENTKTDFYSWKVFNGMVDRGYYNKVNVNYVSASFESLINEDGPIFKAASPEEVANRPEAEGVKRFKVAAVSSNANSFGLHNVVLVAKDGEAWSVKASQYNLPEKGMTYIPNKTRNGWGWAEGWGFEIPERLHPDAPPAVVSEVWGI
jgi:hypothetical protein